MSDNERNIVSFRVGVRKNDMCATPNQPTIITCLQPKTKQVKSLHHHPHRSKSFPLPTMKTKTSTTLAKFKKKKHTIKKAAAKGKKLKRAKNRKAYEEKGGAIGKKTDVPEVPDDSKKKTETKKK